MYKKVTHTIFEEHFAHPEVLKLTAGNTDIKSKMVDSTLPNILRRQTRDVVTHWVGRMRDTILANVNGTEDAVLAAQFASTEVNNLAEIYGRYYPLTDTNNFAAQFGIYTSTIIEMAKAIKNNTDLTALQTQNTDAIEAFAQIMVSSMNVGWTKDDIIFTFTEVASNWLNQVRARLASNWSTDLKLIAKNESYMAAGTPIQTGFADMFSNSIIMSFPNQF